MRATLLTEVRHTGVSRYGGLLALCCHIVMQCRGLARSSIINFHYEIGLLVSVRDSRMSALPSIFLYAIATLSSLALAAYGWQRRTFEARPFSWLMLAVAFWSLCHTLSVASATQEQALLWAQIQYAGIVAVGPCWLLFALAYSKRWQYVTRLVIVLLIVPPLLAYAVVLTNNWHFMWWSTVRPDPNRPFVAIAVQRAPLFWLHALYSYTCVVAGMALFVYTLTQSRLLYRSQAQMVVLGAMFPIIGNIAHLMGVQVRAVDDPTPLLFTASGAMMFYATRHFHLLSLTPSAQQGIADDLPDGLIVLDHRGVIATMNPAAMRLLQAPADAWLGHSFHELADVSPLAAALEPIWPDPGAALTTSVRYMQGVSVSVAEVRLRPIGAGRGQDGTLLLLRDVTDRTIMEQQLERRLSELTLISQIARVANAAAHTDVLMRTITGEIVNTMQWDRVMIGLLEADRTTLHLVADSTPADAPPVLTDTYITEHDFGTIFESIRSGVPRQLSISDATLHGSSTAAGLERLGLQTMMLIPLSQRKQALGVLAVGYVAEQIIDWQDLRLYETIGQLVSDAITRARLYEVANEASALKSVFLATVSHELRTPLTSIIGYADMLDQGVFGPLPERTLEPLDHVRRNGQMLLQLINDILDFSKMEAGHLNVDLYAVDVTSVICSVAGTLQPQLRARNLTLELDLAPSLPLARANSGRLEQIVTNLLANAVKFTEHGFIRVHTEANENLVQIRIQDTGIGIAAEQLGRIFQPFHQVDNQLTRRFGGTGLGLAITRRLTELMQGEISVESVPGQGATFTCTFPVAALDVLRTREASF